MAENHPEQWQAIVENGNYSDHLQFVKDAYAEHLADPNDETLQIVYLGTLDRLPLTEQIQISLDFTLVQMDMTLRQTGAHTVFQALLRGASVNQTTRDQLIAKLKSDLGGLNTPSRDAFDYARYAAESLMLLGDDAGLDCYLTDSAQMRSLRLKDNWKSDTDASRFDQLGNQYSQSTADADRVTSAFYQLAKSRRNQGQEVKPIAPLVDLDKLKKF